MKTTNNNAAVKDNKQFQGVDKDPREEKGKGEQVTKNDLRGKEVDRIVPADGKKSR